MMPAFFYYQLLIFKPMCLRRGHIKPHALFASFIKKFIDIIAKVQAIMKQARIRELHQVTIQDNSILPHEADLKPIKIKQQLLK